MKCYNLFENKDHKQYLPSIFINGVIAETGQHIITSNLKLPENSRNEYLDFHDSTNGDLPVYGAALNCCRFSGITPGALYIRKGIKTGHIVDGGFRDVTGLETILTVLEIILPKIEAHNKAHKIKIRPTILYIKNSKYTKDDSKAMRLGHDLGTLGAAVFHCIGTGKQADYLVDRIENLERSTNLFKFQTLSLDSCRKNRMDLPLGWYLSDSAKVEIKGCVDSLMKAAVFCKCLKPVD